jgi:hypothetical protein
VVRTSFEQSLHDCAGLRRLVGTQEEVEQGKRATSVIADLGRSGVCEDRDEVVREARVVREGVLEVGYRVVVTTLGVVEPRAHSE